MYKPKTKVTCKLCGDVIYSVTSGKFTECKCKSSYIDETQYYARVGGNKEDVVIEPLTKEDFRDFIWTTATKEQIKIRDLSDSHIENIIKDFDKFGYKNHYYYVLMKEELKIRKKNEKETLE